MTGIFGSGTVVPKQRVGTPLALSTQARTQEHLSLLGDHMLEKGCDIQMHVFVWLCVISLRNLLREHTPNSRMHIYLFSLTRFVTPREGRSAPRVWCVRVLARAVVLFNQLYVCINITR